MIDFHKTRDATQPFQFTMPCLRIDITVKWQYIGQFNDTVYAN